MAVLSQELQDAQTRNQVHADAVDSAKRSMPGLLPALKYSRYETALQNQLHRTLSRLERIQLQRDGEFVAPPLQIELSRLDVSHRDL